MRKQFLGQDDPRRIADLGDFKLHVHTAVITETRAIANTSVKRRAGVIQEIFGVRGLSANQMPHFPPLSSLASATRR